MLCSPLTESLWLFLHLWGVNSKHHCILLRFRIWNCKLNTPCFRAGSTYLQNYFIHKIGWILKSGSYSLSSFFTTLMSEPPMFNFLLNCIIPNTIIHRTSASSSPEAESLHPFCGEELLWRYRLKCLIRVAPAYSHFILCSWPLGSEDWCIRLLDWRFINLDRQI